MEYFSTSALANEMSIAPSELFAKFKLFDPQLQFLIYNKYLSIVVFSKQYTRHQYIETIAC